LPVEVWTRFMRAAHQGVPVAALPNSQTGGLFSNLVQAASQVSAPSAPTAGAQVASVAARPTRTAVRPDATTGLDGWLMDRLFGR
jgi:penicillin-binding protein 1A